MVLERVRSDDFYIAIIKYEKCQYCGAKSEDIKTIYTCGSEFWAWDYGGREEFTERVAKALGVYPLNRLGISSVLAAALQHREEFYEFLEVFEKIQYFINPTQYHEIHRAICGAWDYMQLSGGAV